jgi:hypothetical protein
LEALGPAFSFSSADHADTIDKALSVYLRIMQLPASFEAVEWRERFYVAAIRQQVRLLQIRKDHGKGAALPFVYADGAHDAEVLLIHPTTGATWIVTKLLSSLGGLYRLDDLGLGRVGRAVYRRTLEAPAGFGGLTTGGDVHPDAARVLLRTYNRVWEYRGDPAASIETILAGIPVEVPTARQPQGEAVAYLADGRSYLLGSEKVGTPFYRVDCRTPAAPAPPESPPAAP